MTTKRKRIIVSIAAGVAVAGLAVYLFGTKSGKKELKRLRNTGKATAGSFKTLGKEVVKNIKAVRNEERKRAVRAYLHQSLSS